MKNILIYGGVFVGLYLLFHHSKQKTIKDKLSTVKPEPKRPVLQVQKPKDKSKFIQLKLENITK
tara:strand:+ start:5582 stop:5773 length:192 start_codon:yes stop_codon:yes gene_type:complete